MNSLLKKQKGFLEPALLRWQKRRECACEEPATMRCTRHKNHLCGGRTCTDLHRWAHDYEPCVFEAMNGPLDYALYTLGVLVAGLSLLWVATYLGVL
jgi:hypothetical protein